MNMPLDENHEVHFTTTLMALIREALDIKNDIEDDLNVCDDELRALITKLWPVHAKKRLNLIIPHNEGSRAILHFRTME